MKKILLSPWMGLVTLFICIAIHSSNPSFIESVQLRYFDTLITSKAITTSENVKIVNIDDESLKKYGQFPFPRNQYADIINDLYKRNAGLVVFNVYMPDADRFGKDDVLAKTLKANPVILPQMGGTEKSKYKPFNPGVSVIGDNATKYTVDYPEIEPNVQILNDSASGIGVANVLPEIDGVVRRMPMVVSSKGVLYPNIGLETLRVASGDPSFQIKSNGGIEALRIPSYGKITTDSIGRIWLDWSKRPKEYSLVNLPSDFTKSIVIVGLTAKGLNNPVATATGGQYPHYVQSSVLDTLISGTNISRPSWADGSELILLIVLSIVAIFLTKWKYGFIPFIGIIGAIWYSSVFSFNHYNYLLDCVYPIFTLVLVYTHVFTVKFITELNQKLQIKKQFGTYLSPAMVEKLQKDPSLLKLGGERRELSIMFTDVRGFTSISEHYGDDVEGLTKIMNRYMTAMTAKIIENEGTLDKYIGDAQMAFWNAPLDDANHAKHAVKTALEMLGSLDAFNEEVEKEGIPAFGMGLGINTGAVVVGNMGSSQRFDYTCLGDAVNLASRLEGQSKPYGVRIVLGPLTAKQVEDEFFVTELDIIAVKGKTEGVRIYTVLTSPDKSFEKSRESHEKMLSLYRSKEFNAASILCELLRKDFGGQLESYYDMMINRCSEMKEAQLPDDWDGVYRATSK